MFKWEEKPVGIFNRLAGEGAGQEAQRNEAMELARQQWAAARQGGAEQTVRVQARDPYHGEPVAEGRGQPKRGGHGKNTPDAPEPAHTPAKPGRKQEHASKAAAGAAAPQAGVAAPKAAPDNEHPQVDLGALDKALEKGSKGNVYEGAKGDHAVAVKNALGVLAKKHLPDEKYTPSKGKGFDGDDARVLTLVQEKLGAKKIDGIAGEETRDLFKAALNGSAPVLAASQPQAPAPQAGTAPAISPPAPVPTLPEAVRDAARQAAPGMPSFAMTNIPGMAPPTDLSPAAAARASSGASLDGARGGAGGTAGGNHHAGRAGPAGGGSGGAAGGRGGRSF